MPNLHPPLPQSLRQEFNNNKKGASNYPEFTLCDPLCAMVTANTNPEREGGGTPIWKPQSTISNVMHPYSLSP